VRPLLRCGAPARDTVGTVDITEDYTGHVEAGGVAARLLWREIRTPPPTDEDPMFDLL